jgi:hypothetical protein
MKGPIHHYLDELKKQLATRAGIRQISSSDCKFLSVDIYKETSRRISETTLKRIYGFASSKFAPSSFTLNSISEYCGYKGWEDFCSIAKSANINSSKKPDSLSKIAENAARITDYTLHILKAKSGIPYEKTISRNFLHEHMKMFLSGDYMATLLSAPADFGKTTALCHWVDDLIERNSATGKKDIILFFNNNVLLNPTVSANSLHDWLLALLGIYGDEDLSGLADLHKGINNFYLIIDALDSNPTKIDYPIFNQLIDIISLYKDHKWLKVIISVRSGICASNWHHIINSQQKWFLGFMTSDNSYINVPMFDYNEILQIADNLRPGEKHSLDPEMLPDFSYPLCLQYHYQNDPENFSLKMSSEFSVFEAVSSFFLNRIYRNRYKDEMGMLLLILVEEMDIINENYTVNSFDIYKTLRDYEKAYHELLNLGFLQEINISDGVKFVNNISVVSKHGLHRILARKLLIECNYVFDDKLIDKLNTEYSLSIRPDVLKWCVYLIVSADNPCSFDLLKKAQVNISDRAGIGIFLANMVVRHPDILYKEPLNAESDKVNNIDYFFSLEYLGKRYDHVLELLLPIISTEKYAIISRSYISFMAVIQLDIKKLETQIAELKSFPAEHYLEFSINPLICLEAIYYYLRFGIIQKEALAQLTRFYFKPVIQKNISYPVPFNEILHMIGLYTLSICNNEKKTMRYITALKKIYPLGSICYNFLFRILKAEIYLSLGKENDAVRILQHLKPYYEEQEFSLTGFMKISYLALKIKLENLDSIPNVDQINIFSRFCDDEHCTLIKATSLAFLLKKNPVLRDDPQYFDQFYFDLVKTTREHGCRVGSFDV